MSEHTHIATLVRGLTYFLGSKKFEKGIPVPVTDEERERLEAHAIDYITAGDENIEREKFKFEPIDDADEGAEVETPATPTRRSASPRPRK